MTAALATADLDYARDGATLRAYGAWPRAGSQLPGLVVIPDVRGLTDHYRDIARRFANEGFFALAIDIYSREGTPDLPDMESVFTCIQQIPDPRVTGDVGAAVQYLARRPEVRIDRIGVTGYCLGGQYALMSACSVPGLAACVSWYGMLRYAEHNERKPISPLELAPRLACPYLGLFGAEDTLIPSADVEELRTILARGGKRFTLKSYAGAGHAFFNDTRPEMYRPDAAADAWPRAVGFLRALLG
jgi:carboxymethylenebutenolidase